MPRLKPFKRGAYEWTPKIRARAWIFGMGNEILLGLPVAPITDGESYTIGRIFPAGVPIPKGENEQVNRQAVDSTEFHLAQEMTDEDIVHIAQTIGGRVTAPAHVFLLDASGMSKDRDWRVRYVARKGTSLASVLVLKEKLSRQARMFVAMKSFKMKAFRDGIEHGLPPSPVA